MNLLKHEFGKFINSLTPLLLSDQEKRIISIVYDNFDEVLETHSRGRDNKNRGKYISQKILDEISGNDFSLPKINEELLNNGNSNSDEFYLSKLKVSYFRGFGEEEIFVFHKKFNFIYGFNGTGKSSFSESLEYKLTGNIREASHRGYKNNLDEYIKNTFYIGFSKIELTDNNGNYLQTNPDFYRFSFIEKSRIDDFVKHKNQGALDSIQNLFGFGEFNKFISEFNNDIKGKLAIINQGDIELLNLKKIKNTEINELKLDLDNEINGIKIIIKENNFKENVYQNYDDFIIKTKNIVDIESEKINKYNNELIQKNIKIDEEIKEFERYNKKIPKIKILIVITSILLGILLTFIFNNFFLLFITLISLVTLFINKKDTTILIEKKNDLGDSLNLEKVNLLNQKIISFETKLEILNKKNEDYQDFLNYNKDNLLKSEENERNRIELIKYENAYSSFITKLEKYKNSISEGLIKQNLEEKTIEIFNLLSNHKLNKIVIKTLNLPKNEGEKLLIEDLNGNKIDALKIFSEGNLRCLGISILLSKIIIDNQKFLILDDIVNSLDFEFRKSMINLFMNFSDLSNKQFIITTHSETFLNLFIENLDNNSFNQYLLQENSIKKIIPINGKTDLLTLIKSDLDKSLISHGLSKSRKALEKYIAKISKELIKGFLEATCYSNFEINTANRLKALKGNLLKINQNGIYDKIIENLNVLDGNSNYYKYLNSETHDSKSLEDVSPHEAQEIYNALLNLKNFKNLVKIS